MSGPVGESTITYEQLNDLSEDFDEADRELMRREYESKEDLYEKRSDYISKIPNFWPLVFEQAPPDLDEFIQPSDSALLLSSLTGLRIWRPGLEKNAKPLVEGLPIDPRDFTISFEFAENDYFENKILEKSFYYRESVHGWSGLVSEPVDIKWKKGKDLTAGMSNLVCKIWKSRHPRAPQKFHGEPPVADLKALSKKIESVGLGGLSFFAWFSYIGRAIGLLEDMQARLEARNERLRREGNPSDSEHSIKAGADLDRAEEEDTGELEIFPEGETLALLLAEDLWPNAIKYFVQAQEQEDDASEDDFESEDEDEDADGVAEPPAKKLKS